MRSLTPVAVALALATLPGLAHAGADHRRAGKFGIGLGGGTNTGGVSAKYWMGDSTALQLVAGGYGKWGSGSSGLGLNADYLLEMPALTEAGPVEIAWNVGAGAGVGLFPAADVVAIQGAGVAGLEFALIPVPLDITLEYRPTIGITPNVGLDLVNFTGHIRWFF
jgi:hypothetical protein